MNTTDEQNQTQVIKTQEHIDLMQDIFRDKIKALEDQTNQQINKVKQDYLKLITDEEATAKPSKSKVNKLESDSYAEIQELVMACCCEADEITKAHIDEVANYCNQNGLAMPEPKSIDLELVVSKVREVNTKKEVVKKTSLEDKLAWMVFFLVLPLGMVVLEDYFFGGMLLVIGSGLHLPPLSKKLLKSYPWLNSLNLILLSNTLIVAGFVKLLHFS